ncbi:hypothetical protein OAA40_00800 [bacterium]|nr:hypothetical protein [bacterium]
MSTLKVNTIQPFTSGAVLLNDNIEASGSLTPTTTNLYNLGSSTRQWRDLHVSGTANIDLAQIDSVSGSLIPREDDTLDLGSSTKQWKDLYVDGTANIDAISIDVTAGSSQDLASSAIYSVNGSKVEVKAITAANLADGAFVQFTLLNTSIAANSIVLGSFTGGTGGLITGSILTAATIGASTASVQIHNETGAQIDADSAFTASFVIL